jgi:hypothetical protein
MENILLLTGIFALFIFASLIAIRSGVKESSVSPMFVGVTVGLLGGLVERTYLPHLAWYTEFLYYFCIAVVVWAFWIAISRLVSRISA